MPEKSEHGRPGADSSGAGAWKHLCGMRKPLVASGERFEASSVKLVGDGGSTAQWWNSGGAGAERRGLPREFPCAAGPGSGRKSLARTVASV